MSRHFRGYKTNTVPLDEYRKRVLYTRRVEIWCPSCPAFFESEDEYKLHYRTEHYEQKKKDAHIIRMEKLRHMLLKTVRNRNGSESR